MDLDPRLAFLGAVLAGYTALEFLPDTPIGQTAVFVAFYVALYPLARKLLFAGGNSRHYWIGLAIGAPIGWALDSWRRTLPGATVRVVSLTVVGLMTAACLVMLRRGRAG